MKQKHFLIGGVLVAIILIIVVLMTVQGIVGGTIITKTDVKLRNEILKIYFPEEKRDLGYYLLVKSYIQKAILENHGMKITDEMIEKEEKRIETQTRDANKLRQITDVFEGDKSKYRKIFIVPALAEKMLYHDLFLRSDEIQASTLQRANMLLEKFKTEKNIDETMKAADLVFSELVVDEIKGIRAIPPESIAREREKIKKSMEKKIKALRNKRRGARVYEEPDPEAKGWYETFLKDLEPGQFVDRPVNRGGYWMLLRLLEKESENPFRIKLQSVIVPKEDFDRWKEQESQKIWVFPKPESPTYN